MADYPSSPDSDSSSYTEPVQNLKKHNHCGFYSDRPSEIDYDPPPFIHPTDDEEEEEVAKSSTNSSSDADSLHHNIEQNAEESNPANNQNIAHSETTTNVTAYHHPPFQSNDYRNYSRNYDQNHYDLPPNHYNSHFPQSMNAFDESQNLPATPSQISSTESSWTEYNHTYYHHNANNHHHSVRYSNQYTPTTHRQSPPIHTVQHRRDPPHDPISKHQIRLQPSKAMDHGNICSNFNDKASSINDGGAPPKDCQIMMKLIEKLEKRQTKNDKNKSKVREKQKKLKAQKERAMKQFQFDKKSILQHLNTIELRMNEQFDAMNGQYVQHLSDINAFGKELDKIYKSTSKVVWSRDTADKKAANKKECKRIIRKFDEKMKKMKIFDPCLEYGSFLAQRHAKYENYVNGIDRALNMRTDDWQNHVQQPENALVFAEGYLRGIVPIKPDRVDVSLTNSFERKRFDERSLHNRDYLAPYLNANHVGDDEKEESPSPPLSELSLATNQKFNVTKNIRVIIVYDAKSEFYRKSCHILKHEIVVELKNMKPFIVCVEPSRMDYECAMIEDLKIYEGVAKVRSMNKNGWSGYQTEAFKFDEYGNKLSMTE